MDGHLLCAIISHQGRMLKPPSDLQSDFALRFLYINSTALAYNGSQESSASCEKLHTAFVIMQAEKRWDYNRRVSFEDYSRRVGTCCLTASFSLRRCSVSVFLYVAFIKAIAARFAYWESTQAYKLGCALWVCRETTFHCCCCCSVKL